MAGNESQTNIESIGNGAQVIVAQNGSTVLVGSACDTDKSNHLQIKDSDRRIDAAAPSHVPLGETFDVLVQVRLPTSPPLGIADWPIDIKPDAIKQTSQPVSIGFPVDHISGKPITAKVWTRVVAPDFAIEGATEKQLCIPPDTDSPKLTFLLTAKKRGHCRINIEIYQDKNARDWIGTIPVTTVVNGSSGLGGATVASLVIVVVVPKEERKPQQNPPASPPSLPPDTASANFAGRETNIDPAHLVNLAKLSLEHVRAGRDLYTANELHIHQAASPFQASLLRQLPPPVDLVGRDAECTQLEAKIVHRATEGGALSGASIGLQGMGGVGKTALAVTLAHRLKDHYPDAHLYLNLHGADPEGQLPSSPADVMRKVILGFQPTARLPESINELTPIYRAVLAEGDRRNLLLLDNAANADQVRPLLPPPNCLLLVTSRQQFSLPGMQTQYLDSLAPAQSRELLIKLAPRIGADADVAAALCGHLPLALEVFAGLANDKKLYPVSKLLERVRTQKEKLGPVEAAFKVSYDLLTESLQQRWTALAVFPASFDLSAVASVWLADEESTRQDLQALFNASLVEWNETSGRFRLHDLAKQFSLSHLDPATWERRMLLHAQHFMEVGARTDDLYLEGDENVLRGLALFDRERTHIEVIFERLKTRIDRESSIRLATLVNAVVYISALRHTPRERIVWLEAQRTAYRRLGDRRGEGNALGNLGLAHVNLGNTRKAIEFYEEALAIHREIGDRRGESNSLGNLGVAYSALGYSRKAIEFYEEALAIDRAIGDRRGEGNDLGNLANAHANLGDTSKAIEFYKQALVIDHEIGDRRGEGNDLGNLGNVYFELGDSHKAIDFFEQALVIDREIGDRGGESKTLGNLGSAYAKLGDMIKAFGFFEQHMAIAREFGDRRGEASALGNLGTAHEHLGDTRKAIEFYEQQLVIAREIGDRRGEGNALFNSALSLSKLDQSIQAIAQAEAALAIYEAIESPHRDTVRATLEKWRRRKKT